MEDFLGQLDHFPCSGEDSFIALFLPELYVERTIGKATLDQSCFPCRILRSTHFPSSSWLLTLLGYQPEGMDLSAFFDAAPGTTPAICPSPA
jgi:hypothetical protein